MPDYEEQVTQAFPELDYISSDNLRSKVIEAWTLALDRGGWRDIMDIPYAWNIHEVTNVRHVRGVTKIARESAIEQQEFHGANPDIDVIVAATLLHDVGKCYEYVDFVEDEKLPTQTQDTQPKRSHTPCRAMRLLTKSAVRWRSSERFRTLSARFRRGHWRPNSSRVQTPRPRTRLRSQRWVSHCRNGLMSTPRRSHCRKR